MAEINSLDDFFSSHYVVSSSAPMTMQHVSCSSPGPTHYHTLSGSFGTTVSSSSIQYSGFGSFISSSITLCTGSYGSSVITYTEPKIDLDSVAREFSDFKSRIRKTQNTLKRFDKQTTPGTLFRLNESFNDLAQQGWIYYSGPKIEEVSFFFKESSLEEGWFSLPTGSLLLYVGLSKENYFSKFNFKTLKFLHNNEVVNWPASISAIEDQSEKLFNIFKKVE